MLPFMPDKTNKTSKQISVFAGINQNQAIHDNELVSSINMTSKDYPVLSVSKSFETQITSDTDINGAINYNGLFYTAFDKSQNKLYAYLNDKNALVCENALPGNRFFAGLSDNILIMPDKVLYTVSSNSVKALSDLQFFDVESAIKRANEQMPGISSTIPQSVAVITSRRIASNTVTYGIYTSYMMSPTNINEGEFVFVKMHITTGDWETDKSYKDLISTLEKGIYIKITQVNKLEHSSLNGTIEDVYSFDFEGAVNISGDDTMYVTDITIEKRIPDLSHMCTYGNRIWGVEKNSIRCSLLGDGSVWEDYSSDTFGTLPSSCFSLEVDSGGEFTAICEYNGNILAFKENCVHKIYGNQPENYTLHTQSIKGVQKGAEATLVNVNGVLYYKGIDGFYRYNGGVPVCISGNLDMDFKVISSCSDGSTYYTIVEKDGKREILTYDTIRGIWHTISTDNAFLLLYSDNYVTSISSDKIQKLTDKNQDNTKWSFEFQYDEDTFCQKRYSRILLDYSLKKNGYFKVTVTYDDNPTLKHICGDYIVSKNSETIINLPFIKCKKINIRFEGRGDFTLKKLTREYILLKEGGK